MINSFEITNYLGESIILDLADPYKTGLAIESVKGLGPVKADIHTSEIVTMDGSIYNGGRSTKRNIVFKFIFLASPTIEETRSRCYKYFPINQKVSIVIRTSFKELQTYGYVESNEITIFDKDSKKSSSGSEFKCGAQVSIICPDSFFKSLKPIETSLSCLERDFDFPSINSEDPTDITNFADDSIVKNITSDPIEFGLINTKKELIVNYEGDVAAGFLMNLHLLGPVGNIIITDVSTNQRMTIYTDLILYYLGLTQLEPGDDIYVSTHKGDKYIYFIRNGLTFNIMSCIDINSNWFQLQRGINRFAIKTQNGFENIEFNITTNLLFEGV